MDGGHCTPPGLLAAAVAAVLLLAASLTEAQPQVNVAALEARAAQLRTTLAARPTVYETALELATTLHQLDHLAPNGGRRVPEAAAMYRLAAELASAVQPAVRAYILSNLGALLLGGGRLEAAVREMRASLELAEGLGLKGSEMYVGTLFNLAKAEQQLGRQQESQQLLGRVLQLAKGVAGSTYLKAWAALKSFTPEQVEEMEECWQYLRRSAEGVDGSALSRRQRSAWHAQQARWGWLDGLNDVDKSWIGFGLYHAHHQAGRYDEAWQALQWANSLQDRAAPYTSDQDDANTAAIMRMFQAPKPGSSDAAQAYYAALLAGAGGHRDRSLRPVFVVGMPRSGSTLIEQILASHSQVWGAGEDTALAPLLPDLLAVLSGGGEVQAAKIAAVGRQYLEEMRGRLPPDKAGARWIVDKMLRNMWNVGFISMMLPDACIIHATRHPADTGLSCYAQPFEGRGTPWAANLSNIAHQIELVEALAQHWDRVLPGRVLHVRYCDLVRDQEGTTRRLLAHCGIPWEPAVLDFHTTQRTVATASLAQVRQKLYASSVLRYRQYARHLAPLLRPLRQLILRYEWEAGLEAGEQLLAEVLDGGTVADGQGEQEEGKQQGKHGMQQQQHHHHQQHHRQQQQQHQQQQQEESSEAAEHPAGGPSDSWPKGDGGPAARDEL